MLYQRKHCQLEIFKTWTDIFLTWVIPDLTGRCFKEQYTFLLAAALYNAGVLRLHHQMAPTQSEALFHSSEESVTFFKSITQNRNIGASPLCRGEINDNRQRVKRKNYPQCEMRCMHDHGTDRYFSSEHKWTDWLLCAWSTNHDRGLEPNVSLRPSCLNLHILFPIPKGWRSGVIICQRHRFA